MSKISIREEGKDRYDENEYFSGSQILNHDYQDKLTNIFIDSHCSLNVGERTRLADNIHQVRKIFSEHTDNTISSMWINVFNTGKLDIDKFKEAVEMRPSQTDWKPYWKSNIHVRFGDVQDKVLVYSWLDINQQFNQDKWNNLLSQLEGDYKINLIGTGPFTFKYKDLSYRVYPPLFGSSDDEESSLNDPEVFNFSPTEVNKIIEDIKESHQSIKKKIAKSLGKDFAENNEGYIKIKADIDKTSSVKNFTDVSYISRNNKQIQIEEAFVKEEERDNVGNLLHLAVYTNNKSFMEQFLGVIDVNKVNKNDRTPLHLAAKYGRKDMVEMLLNKGAKIDVVDSRGRTPLHLAAQNNNKEIAEALIKAKANVNIKDEDEKTPLDLTTNEEIKTLLKEAVEKTDDVNSVDKSPEEKGSEDVEPVEPAQTEEQPSSFFGSLFSILMKPFSLIASLLKEAVEKTDDVNSVDKSPEEKGSEDVEPVEPAQTEEQPSSFFGSLFSILMKPFSLIASFFGGFFSWLFGSDEEKIDESTSQTDASVSLPKLDSLDEKKIDAQPGNHSSLAPNQSAGQADAQQLGADDNQLLG